MKLSPFSAELIDILREKNINFCFNEQEYNAAEAMFIIVGDNPGKLEYETNRFFVGRSGKILRNHFLSNQLVADFDKECIICNKTIIHTPETKDLVGIGNQIGGKLFDAVQEACADEIAKFSNHYNLPVLLVGISDIGPGKLFDAFWRRLKQKINEPDKILAYKHPSHKHFENEWALYKSGNNHISNSDLLLKIGRINRKKIDDKYVDK